MDLYKMSLWQLFLAGGPIMWLILLCSIFACAVFLEKFWQLKKMNSDRDHLLNTVLDKMGRHDTKEALQVCDNNKGIIANILKAGILKYDRPRQQIKEAIEDASLSEIPKIENKLDILLTMAHVLPLLGILGTVTGMVKCFQIIQAKSLINSVVSAADLSAGIWEALLTTVFGLAVAIPVYVAYNYLVSKTNNFIHEMQKCAVELVNLLTE